MEGKGEIADWRSMANLPRTPDSIKAGDTVTVERHGRWGHVNARWLAVVETVWDEKYVTVKKPNGKRVMVQRHDIMLPHVVNIPVWHS